MSSTAATFTNTCRPGRNAATGNEYFSAGQTFVLQINGGDNANAVGSFTWIPITDTTGGPIDGVSVMNADGSIDGRETAENGERYRLPAPGGYRDQNLGQRR